jgi:IclR family transcriptional regulator, KDG regulon repressor
MIESAVRSPGVKVIDKAFDLLEAVGASEQGRSLTDLANALGLPSATVFRLLKHLERRGYIEQDPRGKLYFLGLRVLVLRGGAIRSIQLAARARPFLREMMVTTNCLSHLAVLRDSQVVYIDRVETPNTVARFVPIGNRAPAYCTALGKVLLSGCSNEELDAYLARARFVPLTPNTIVTPEDLRAQMNLVRRRGYALDVQEQEMGVWCVGAPVRDFAGRTIAAVSVSMRHEPPSEGVQILVSAVVETAMKISQEVGYRPPTSAAALELQLD